VGFLLLVCGCSCFHSVCFKREDLDRGCLRLWEVVGRRKYDICERRTKNSWIKWSKWFLKWGELGGDASLGFVELNGVGVSDVSLDSEELNVDAGVSDAFCRICCKIISSIWTLTLDAG